MGGDDVAKGASGLRPGSLIRAALLASIGGLLGAAGRVAPCDPAGRDLCGLERAEDVAFVPGSDWFVVSTSSTEAPLVFIDAGARRRVVAPVPAAAATPTPATAQAAAPGCPGPHANFGAGGNDIRRVRGQLRLAVINRAAAAAAPDAIGRVELFEVSIRDGAPRMRWLDCLPVPPPYTLNDVALAGDGTVYASHSFERPRAPTETTAMRENWLAGTPTGYAIEWPAGAAGWRRVPGTEVAFTNGIAVSRDDRVLAVAGTYSSAVLLVDRRSGAVRRVPIRPTPDNLTPLADGGFLAVGHTGVPVTGVDPCRDAAAVPCGFPFAVVRIDPGGQARVVYEHDGSRMPGASVAVPHGRLLYLGSFFGDRVSVVDRPAGVPHD
jgi:hypothetical protein